MTGKLLKLSPGQIRPLVRSIGGCIATDMITVEGYPVRFMFRERPHNEHDGGWRFLSGFEDDAYMSDPQNLGIYDANTIANYDPSIIPLLEEPFGSVFEKGDESERFERVTDWSPYED